MARVVHHGKNVVERCVAEMQHPAFFSGPLPDTVVLNLNRSQQYIVIERHWHRNVLINEI